MPSRLPGLTPGQHACLHEKVVEGLVQAGVAIEVSTAAAEAALDLVSGHLLDLHSRRPPVSRGLEGRLMAFADQARTDGRPGLARDVDLLAGLLSRVEARHAREMAEARGNGAGAGADAARDGWRQRLG